MNVIFRALGETLSHADCAASQTDRISSCDISNLPFTSFISSPSRLSIMNAVQGQDRSIAVCYTKIARIPLSSELKRKEGVCVHLLSIIKAGIF